VDNDKVEEALRTWDVYESEHPDNMGGGVHQPVWHGQRSPVAADQRSLKVEAQKLWLDHLKRTTNAKRYSETHAQLQELMEGSEAPVPTTTRSRTR
jgi:hypothetical protein